MTIHEPTVYDEGPNTTPRYRIDWQGNPPQPGDTIHMSAELFERCITILNGEPEPTQPEETHNCPRCNSPKWVSVSLNGGITRIAQCVPCGAYGDRLGPGWRTEQPHIP